MQEFLIMHDLLAPNALYEIARYLENDPEADGVYTDEDKVTTELDEHFQPHLKPDFNLDLLGVPTTISAIFLLSGSQSYVKSVDSVRNLTEHRIIDSIFRLRRRSRKDRTCAGDFISLENTQSVDSG